MTNDTTESTEYSRSRQLTGGRSLRRTGELIGIGVVALLSIVMILFVVSYRLQAYPGTGVLYETFVLFGQLLDQILGTNVFKHPFMWLSLATALLVGIVAPLVGSFLVHREMALIGETLAHTAFAGVAIGFLFDTTTGWGTSVMLSALVVAILGALAVQWLAERTNAYGDVPIAIMLTGSFAVATLIISYGRGFTGINIEGYLFGNLSIVTPEGAQLMVLLTIVVVAVVAYTYKQLLFITFDEQAARVAQLNVTRYNGLLIVMTAIVVVGAMQILGVILVAGMLVIPVAAASQVANSFRETLYLSILFGQVSVVGGFALSIYGSFPSGGSIVVVSIIIYLLAIAASGRAVTSLSTH
ncbi:metal ABC transporter permease [Natrialba sp. SSL1]|uniref:metal ABC transporter permease n=1 Tax=Natrialba sp. SSL1 TaxID=1869245 RepID=UPI0008F80A31|nr:metal ABC transporter permease [Natrialba sp. SSL1]OIB57357.1 zinc ABC transporter permease [Natrialba sp. SSL1]